jgi:enoyl-CoA hydratase/carnithine racemase
MGLVSVEDRGPVRHLVLNRPEKRNAFNLELVRALAEALRGAAEDGDVRVVVLRGEGPVFSAGVDLGQITDFAGGVEMLRPFRGEWIGACAIAEQMPKPVVASIHGACFGGALETVLACDLRVVTADAKLGLPETRLGLIPDVGGCSRLPAVVGVGRAKELILTGRTITGTEAERIGLANRAVADDELEATTDELVGELLEAQAVPVGLAKGVIDAAAKPALATTLEYEVAAQQACVTSDEFRELAQAAAATATT